MNRQSNRMTTLYCRLSRDDDNEGDSNSIQHQKFMLEKYAKEHTHLPYRFFVDDGYSGTSFNRPGKIARMLRERKIVTPGTLAFHRTGYVRNYDPERPCFWNESIIANILEHKEYLGHTMNFKTNRKSFKSKKTIENPEDKQVMFENTHEAIVDRET